MSEAATRGPAENGLAEDRPAQSTSTDGFGVCSSVAVLRKVAMRRPGAMLTADHERWHYTKPLDPVALTAQYEVFAGLVAASGAEIHWLPEDDGTGAVDDLADSVFTYDPSFGVPGGAVVLRPGKPLRAGEAGLHADFYESAGIPILGRIDVPGLFEGGDCFWLDATTLAVGRGFRTNQSGIDQMAEIVAPLGVTVDAFDLPYHLGPDACLHLMSVVSVLDDDLALVHAPLMPTALYQRMLDMGYALLEAPAGEFAASLGLNLNVLATAPRQVIAIDGFDGTLALMREAGCEVTTFVGDELCIPCEGGPTCLTRPLLRG
ncbi:MAG: arginine deiminase family protein [Ilumatobacter sp.]|uniref:dimethylarginine dimethylaminohydrolase family protein n=1 Tax=Ilumatobacter sp. TaxID=1967498 RepID=UPI003298D430